MSSLQTKLNALNKARSERDFELAIYSNMESKNGPGNKEAEAHHVAKVDPLHDKVVEAEHALAETKAATVTEALAKVAALIHEGMEPETVDALKADAERFLDPDRDPIVPLYRRWKALWETTYKLVDECPTGNWDAPELTEAEIEMYKIEDKMITLVPISIEGLVALADYLWLKEGPSARVGTEKWCDELTRIEHLPIRRIRHGAALMAGVSLSEVPGAKPI